MFQKHSEPSTQTQGDKSMSMKSIILGLFGLGKEDAIPPSSIPRIRRSVTEKPPVTQAPARQPQTSEGLQKAPPSHTADDGPTNVILGAVLLSTLSNSPRHLEEPSSKKDFQRAHDQGREAETVQPDPEPQQDYGSSNNNTNNWPPDNGGGGGYDGSGVYAPEVR
jgi:hypothetical protein